MADPVDGCAWARPTNVAIHAEVKNLVLERGKKCLI